MARKALIDSNGRVRNLIEYDPDGDYQLPEGFSLVDPTGARIGGSWDGTKFIDPPAPPPSPPAPPSIDVLTAMSFVARNTIKAQVNASTFKTADVTKVAPLFPKWAVGLTVAVGELYVYDNQLVQVIQAHTTQADWTPPATPALWNIYRDPSVIAPWVQPESTNPYRLGDKVTYNGKTWESINDANVWAPPTQWKEVTA